MWAMPSRSGRALPRPRDHPGKAGSSRRSTPACRRSISTISPQRRSRRRSGSRISLRFYGNPEDITVTSDLGPPPPGDAGGATQTLIVERSGSLTVFAPSGTQSWDISVRADAAPSVALDGELEGEPPGQMQLTFTASDDFGVAAGTATFRLDPDAADRRFGLAVDPEPREALTLDLPMPFRGSRTDFTEVMVEDLPQHPFANLPSP
jgi:hypothetical protein